MKTDRRKNKVIMVNEDRKKDKQSYKGKLRQTSKVIKEKEDRQTDKQRYNGK